MRPKAPALGSGTAVTVIVPSRTGVVLTGTLVNWIAAGLTGAHYVRKLGWSIANSPKVPLAASDTSNVKVSSPSTAPTL